MTLILDDRLPYHAPPVSLGVAHRFTKAGLLWTVQPSYDNSLDLSLELVCTGYHNTKKEEVLFYNQYIDN